MVQYIHLNPIRGKLVKTIKGLNSYKYSGHSVLLGNQEYDWRDKEAILSQFGKYKKKATASYLQFITEGIKDKRREDLSGGGILRTAGGWEGLAVLKKRIESIMGDERILGDSDFVEKALTLANQKDKEIFLLSRKKYDLEDLIKDAYRYFKVNIEYLKSKSKTRELRNLRSIICYIDRKKTFNDKE